CLQRRPRRALSETRNVTARSVYLCLPTSICKGVAEKPHVHRAVSHNQFLKLL
uniref:Uncharacterized protein n=1 Tax=Ficedula albicollis TaxID=59894 RepID=A0A803V8Z0_FICAL